MLAVQKERNSRQRFTDPVIVGKDILELLSSAMYVDPLTIYREFIQNAADAIDEAEKQGLYTGNIIALARRESRAKDVQVHFLTDQTVLC